MRSLHQEIFRWVAMSKRDLTLVELACVVRFSLGGYETGEQTDTQGILNLLKTCGALLQVVTKPNAPELSTVLIVHETFKYFIRNHWQDYFEKGKVWNGDLDSAKACLAYLGLEVFSKPCSTNTELQERLEKYPLSNYAANYWILHTRDVQSEVQDEVLNTFQSHKKRQSMYQMRTREKPRIDRIDPVPPLTELEIGLSLLHILCENGLIIVCDAFIKQGFDYDDLYVFTLQSTD